MKPQLPSSTNDSSSCRHRTATGRCCRLPALPNSALCFRHAAPLEQKPVDADLSADFPDALADFRSAIPINAFLSRLLTLLVQNRVSTRRAAVLAYITNQLLRTLPAIESELNPPDEEVQHVFVMDMPRPERPGPVEDPALPAAPQTRR